MLDMVKNIQGENRSTALAIRCKARSNVLLQQPILIRSKPSPNEPYPSPKVKPTLALLRNKSRRPAEFNPNSRQFDSRYILFEKTGHKIQVALKICI